MEKPTENLPHAAEAALPPATCSARFRYDSESGFVYDTQCGEWLTSAEEVFEAMQLEIDTLLASGDQSKASGLQLIDNQQMEVVTDPQPNAKLRDAVAPNSNKETDL